jgi:raffinose/stachyose/melibiose transport system permease protein
MIATIAWIAKHFDIFAWATFCAAVGGMITPRFVKGARRNEDVETWIGAILGLAVAAAAYAAGALHSLVGQAVTLVALAAILLTYWLAYLPRRTDAPRLHNKWIGKTFQRYPFQGIFGQFISHVILITWSLIVLIPLWTMLVNSLKMKREIYRSPFSFPSSDVRTFDGFKNAWVDGKFDLYFKNSLIVTVTSLLLILAIGALAAYALANWRSRTSSLIYVYFIAGLMIPIRLGTINIVTIVQDIGLGGKLIGLIPIYVAMGLPITAFVVTSFMRGIPNDLIEAARMDGASEFRVFWQIMLPLVRPALATVTVFNMIPIWNDLWFPLILTRDQEQRTVTYGVSLLFGQYQTDWNAILSTLSMASIPVLILYLLMSKQFIKGLTAGAIKG